MRTYAEVYEAVKRAHYVAVLLTEVGDAYGSPAGIADIMEDFLKMQNHPDYRETLSIEHGLIKLQRDSDDLTYFTVYVNVGPRSKDRDMEKLLTQVEGLKQAVIDLSNTL